MKALQYPEGTKGNYSEVQEEDCTSESKGSMGE